MRSIWVGLVVSAVLFAGGCNSRSQAGNRKGPARAVKAQAELPPDREEDIVTGYGVNAAKARERALVMAQERVRAQLAEKLGTAWRPSEDILDPENLESKGVIRSLGEPVGLTLKDGDWLVAKYHVRLTRPYLQEAARVARQQHMSDRHLLAARVLIGLVALLLVVTGYLRLEELTRGYATTMLRASAVGVLLVVGLGLWMTA
jgi:hypothetical protein